MPHSDEDALVLLAFGEHVPGADAEHVADCAHCTAELHRLTDVVETVRAGTGFGEPLPAPVAPPPSVWAAIAAETGLAAHVNGSTPDLARRATAGPPRIPSPRRRSTWLVAAAAAVAGVIVGIGGMALLGPDDGAAPATQLASTPLEGLAQAASASGNAEVVQTATGRKLVVSTADLGYPQGFYEVWLIDSGVQKMYPVGIIRDGHGEFTIPDGVNLREYPVVDISLEPLDGNPKHSGDSVLRGTLPT